MSDTFGWSSINRTGLIMLPAFGTRIEAIHYAMSVIDGPWPPLPAPKRLTSAQAARWRQIKDKYGMSAIRVRVTPAFGDQS